MSKCCVVVRLALGLVEGVVVVRLCRSGVVLKAVESEQASEHTVGALLGDQLANLGVTVAGLSHKVPR